MHLPPTISRSRPAVALLAALTLLGLARTPAAQATFPGENGRIVFDSFNKAGVWTYGERSGIERLTSSGRAGSPSPSGDVLTYTRRDGIFELDLNSGESERLTPREDRLYVDSGATFLGPDGSRILFTSNREADGGYGDSSIWSMDPNGSDMTPLTRLRDEPLYDDDVASSPDGSLLVFARRVRNKHWSELYTMEPDGSDVRRLTHSGDGFAYDPSFSPDGRRILFTSIRKHRAVLATVPSRGGKVRRITKPRQDFSNGLYSPDGRWIVASDSHPTKDVPEPLVRMNLRGGDREQITPDRFEYPAVTGWIPR